MAGLIAAVYAVLGLAFYPISFGVYQVRVAEALTVLPFLTRAAIPGLFIGCMLANVYGGQGWQDIIFGSLITLAAAVLTRLTGKIKRTRSSDVIACLPALMLWAGGLVLLSQGSMYITLTIFSVLALLLLLLTTYGASRAALSKKTTDLLRIASGIAQVAAAAVAPGPDDFMVYMVGLISLLGAWLMTLHLSITWRRGENPNLLLAPLPPVILNAFGVALYLAPILDFNYWFTVQMIGIGQLIACYVLGLPLLKLLQGRKGLIA